MELLLLLLVQSLCFPTKLLADIAAKSRKPLTDIKSSVVENRLQRVSRDTEKVRVVNGSTPYEGRVEIFSSDVWSSLCDLGWDLENGDVVCRWLGMGYAVSAQKGSFFGSNSDIRLPGYFSCAGTEIDLYHCDYDDRVPCPSSGHNAGVVCSNRSERNTSSALLVSSTTALLTSSQGSVSMSERQPFSSTTTAAVKTVQLSSSDTIVSMDASSVAIETLEVTPTASTSVARDTTSHMFSRFSTSEVAMVTSRESTSSMTAASTSASTDATSPVAMDTTSILFPITTSALTSDSFSFVRSTASVVAMDTYSACQPILASTPEPSPLPSPSPSPSPSPVPPSLETPTSTVVDGKPRLLWRWSPVEGAMGYLLQYSWSSLWTRPSGGRVSRQTSPQRVDLTARETSYTLSDADGFSRYCFSVAAIFPGSMPSSSEQCQSTTTTKPSSPRDVTVGDLMATSLVVSWALPEKPNGIITSYKVNYNTEHIVVLFATVGMVTLNDLLPETVYGITVVAVNGAGDGLPSSVTSVTTDTATPTTADPQSDLATIVIAVVIVVVVLFVICMIGIAVALLCAFVSRQKQYQREETACVIGLKEMESMPGKGQGSSAV